MEKILIEVIKMSISASAAILVVLLLRLPLRKAPKIFSYALWIVVFFQLICPLKFEPPMNFIPLIPQIDTQRIMRTESIVPLMGDPVIENPGNVFSDQTVTAIPPVNTVPEAADGMTVPETPRSLSVSLLTIGTVIWLGGIVLLLIKTVIGFIRLNRLVYDATYLKANIYESDKISNAFVMGFIKPRIYIPLSIQGIQREYILQHEQVHTKRKDYLIKPAAFFILTVHWFNPLVWISYSLMSMDIEMSCDEAVLRNTGRDIRKLYSGLLVSLYTRRPGIAYPVAFGENSFRNIKMRVKNVANFRKSPVWAVMVCVGIVAAFTFGAMIDSPVRAEADDITEGSVVSNLADAVSIEGSIRPPAVSTPQPVKTADEDETEYEEPANKSSNILKGITLEIESVIKNDNSVRIAYSLADEQNMLGENAYPAFEVNNVPIMGSDISTAIRASDGKLYGTIDTRGQFGDGIIELKMKQIRYNQLMGQSGMKINVNLSELPPPVVMDGEWAPSVVKAGEAAALDSNNGIPIVTADENNNVTFLQPDIYNYEIPINAGEGKAWVSNIGVINNNLHVQIKTLNPDLHDGVIAVDVQPLFTDKEGRWLGYHSYGYKFWEDGQSDLSGDIANLKYSDLKYNISESVHDLGQNDLSDLDLSFQSVPSSYINGTWIDLHEPEIITERVEQDLAGLNYTVKDPLTGEDAGTLLLDNLIITPLYFELSLKAEDKESLTSGFGPAMVITYKNGQKDEWVSFSERHTEDDIYRMYLPASRIRYGDAGYLIDVSNIASVTMDGMEIFSIALNK